MALHLQIKAVAILIGFICSMGLSAVVNPHNFKYLINTNRICNIPNIDLFIWVHSSPANIQRRIALRETWANRMNMPKDITTRMVFFLGDIKQYKTQQLLRYEAKFYGDIVQEDYMDSYKNLTYKGMSALKWMSHYCTNTKINMIFKIDDDLMIHVQKLMTHLRRVTKFPEQQLKSTLICNVMNNSPVLREDGKWKVTAEEYTLKVYPTYCSGLAWLMSSDLIKPLLEKAYETPFVWVDDAFLSGIITKNLNITRMHIGGYFHFGGERLTDQFLRKDSGFIFAHVSPYRNDLYYYLWKQVSILNSH